MGLIERGVKMPRIDTLEKIALALEVPIIDVIYDMSVDSKNAYIKKIILKLDNMETKRLESLYLIINELDKLRLDG
jgi:transcriptional regulator with XRE-family HTH domain